MIIHKRQKKTYVQCPVCEGNNISVKRCIQGLRRDPHIKSFILSVQRRKQVSLNNEIPSSLFTEENNAIIKMWISTLSFWVNSES